MNNTDVLKSLGYLKKSLKMTKKAIQNASYKDPTILTELTVMATNINNLINEVDAIEMSRTPSPAIVIPAPTSQGIAPMVQVVAQNASMDNGTVGISGMSNGIDFLDP